MEDISYLGLQSYRGTQAAHAFLCVTAADGQSSAVAVKKWLQIGQLRCSQVTFYKWAPKGHSTRSVMGFTPLSGLWLRAVNKNILVKI